MMTSSRSLEDWANDSTIERAEPAPHQVPDEDEDEDDDKEESEDLVDLEQSLTWFEGGRNDRFIALTHDSARSRRSDGSLNYSHSSNNNNNSHNSSSLSWLQSSRSSLRYPRGPRSPTKLIRFAEVIATDMTMMIQSCSSLGPADLLDMMESYTVAEEEEKSHSTTKSSDSLMDIFELEQQQQQQNRSSMGKNGPLHESQTSFTLSLEHDDDENDHMGKYGDSVKRRDWTPEEEEDEEEDDEHKKTRRRIMYALGGAGLMALVGWTGKLIWQIFHRGGDDDPAGGHIHGNTGGTHHHAILPPPDSAPVLLINPDGGVSNVDPSGSMSQAGFSQSSMGPTAAGGGMYPGGGEQAAMNPALQG